MRSPLRLASLVLPTLLVAPVAAQKVHHKTRGEDPFLGRGFSLAPAGDVDGDGVPDYWTGAPDPHRIHYLDLGGRVFLLSGADGSELHHVDAPRLDEDFGFALAGGRDLDGDGRSDLAIGSPRGIGAAGTPGLVEVLGIAGAPAVIPQSLFTLEGGADGDRFGAALAFLDDLDGDGIAELAIGAPGADVGGANSGSVLLVSGADGATRHTFHGTFPGIELGTVLATVGDLDHDGIRDLAVGSPLVGAGRVVLVSAGSGTVLRTISGGGSRDEFGRSVAGIADLNGDGTDDLVVGSVRGVFAVSGSSGETLWTEIRGGISAQNYAPPELIGYFSTAVAAVGDQDGDGLEDVAVGAPTQSSVWLLSGLDGALLGRETSAHQAPLVVDPLGVFFGYALLPLGDVDGDGRTELVVGAPFDLPVGQDYDVGSTAVLSPRFAPAWKLDVRSISSLGDLDDDGADDVAYSLPGGVVVASGRTGVELRSWPGLSGALAPAGDVDGDGLPDLLVSTDVGSLAGAVQVVSGADGAVLHEYVGQPGDRLGTSGAGLGDLDGDGHADFAIGIPRAGQPGLSQCDVSAGAVRVHSGQTGALLFQVDGYGLPNWDCNWGWWTESFGFSLTAVGDWNLDGTPDFAVGAPGGATQLPNGFFDYDGFVEVRSGTDGSLLHRIEEGSYHFGISIAGGPDFDVDGDGRVDLVVGEQDVGYGPFSTTDGRAHVFSSADGSEILELNDFEGVVGYGNSVGPAYSVAALRDFDGDGFSDVAVGNPVLQGLLGPGVGEVRVFSGLTGQTIARATGTSSWDYLGYTVVNAGDANGDGRTDVLTLAPATKTPSSVPRARFLSAPSKVRRTGGPGAPRDATAE